jgi:hypothetical protein
LPSMSFRKCECGLEFKIVSSANGKRHTLVCDCTREIEIVGSVLTISSGKGGQFASERDWIKVSPERVRSETTSDSTGRFDSRLRSSARRF